MRIARQRPSGAARTPNLVGRRNVDADRKLAFLSPIGALLFASLLAGAAGASHVLPD
jgi:hypothetical protein